jgi:hypothetical protein
MKIMNVEHRIYICFSSRVKIHHKHSYQMKQYFTERNALTVTVGVFCFVMMIVSFVKDQSLWQGIAFALAFSMAVEVICHRAKEIK